MNQNRSKTLVVAFFLLCLGLSWPTELVWGACNTSGCSDDCLPWNRWCWLIAGGTKIHRQYASEVSASSGYGWCTNVTPVGGNAAGKDVIPFDQYNNCDPDCADDVKIGGGTTAAAAGTKTGSGKETANTVCTGYGGTGPLAVSRPRETGSSRPRLVVRKQID